MDSYNQGIDILAGVDTIVNAERACKVPNLRNSSSIPLYTIFSMIVKQTNLICSSVMLF